MLYYNPIYNPQPPAAPEVRLFIRGLRPPSAASAAPEVRLFSFFVRSHLKTPPCFAEEGGPPPLRRRGGAKKKPRELAHKTMGLDRRAKPLRCFAAKRFLKSQKPGSLRTRPWVWTQGSYTY